MSLSHGIHICIWIKKKVKTKNDLIFFLPKMKVQTLDFFLCQKNNSTFEKAHTKITSTEEFSSQATPTPLHCSFGDALRRIES